MQFCFLAVLLTLVFHLKPPKITQLIHNFPFGEIFLLIDLFFYYCETEPVGTNQVLSHWSVIEHRTRKQDKELENYTAQNLENMADLHGES